MKLQELREWRDNLEIDIVEQFLNGFNYAFSIHGGDTVKDYLKHRIELHVHGIACAAESRYYCIRFESSVVDCITASELKLGEIHRI